MVRDSINHMLYKCKTVLIISLLLLGCQSKLGRIGQEHAREVSKWQELALYAGNELKPYGLTVTAGVQINDTSEQRSYSIINVQLNRDSNSTEVDLLAPEFAEKFACGKQCENLGLYDSAFKNEQTQLASFFYSEEGRFFEFYGRLTTLNTTLADYRASAPSILEKYLTLLSNRQLKFNSLSAFIEHLEQNITEEKLLAFSKSGLISPVSDPLNPVFKQDLIASLPDYLSIEKIEGESDFQNSTKLPGGDWNKGESINPDDNWNKGNNINPDDSWNKGKVINLDDNWNTSNLNEETANWSTAQLTTDELFINQFDSVATADLTKQDNWQQAKLKPIQRGGVVCSFSDNIFGLVKQVGAEQAYIDVIAQARVLIDGLNVYPQPGHLFSQTKPFYFVKTVKNESYPISDIAPCSIQSFTTG